METPRLSSTAQFHALEDSPMPTTFVGPDRRYRFVNRSYERWFGLRRDQVVGHTLVEVLGPRAAETIEPYVAIALAGGSVKYEATLPYITRGARRMEVVYAAAVEPDGEVKGFFAYLNDVTARHDAEMAVSAALDGVADGYFAVDRFGRLTTLNPKAAALLRLEARSAVGRTLAECLPKEDGSDFAALVAAVVADGQARRQEMTVAATGGRRFLVDGVPLLTGGAGVVLQDTTEQHQRVLALDLATTRFEAAARASLGLVYDWDLVTNTVWRSPEGVRQVLGCPPERLTPDIDWWTQRMHPDDTVTTGQFLAMAGQITERRYRMRHEDGSWRRILDRSIAVCDAAGAPIRIIGTVFDISALPEALAAGWPGTTVLRPRGLDASEAGAPLAPAG